MNGRKWVLKWMQHLHAYHAIISRLSFKMIHVYLCFWTFWNMTKHYNSEPIVLREPFRWCNSDKKCPLAISCIPCQWLLLTKMKKCRILVIYFILCVLLYFHWKISYLCICNIVLYIWLMWWDSSFAMFSIINKTIQLSDDNFCFLFFACHPTWRILHKNESPLEIGKLYWDLRESTVNCELLVIRTLGYNPKASDLPHKYLVHYLKSLQSWIDKDTWDSVPLCNTAWGFLRDSYHVDLCLRTKPQHLAIACIYFAMEVYCVTVPYNDVAKIPWWKVCKEMWLL